ncbi:hypothetical protein D9619_009466 [Psilocybe cf. subviscida]|uniref:HTH CENPB-type domain-containing protein n=1 Tax=Psilocybe cf. subviscida TaxID=2480587 RepID=A0A8H5BU60_9AGAR|nr:hypothetical protein D9619_009466 [Psilocybe cf. subviscida]
MPGRAKSQLAKRINGRCKHDDLMARAAAAYDAAKKKSPKGSAGYRTICQEISDEYHRETGERINLAHATLQRWVAGGASREEAHQRRGWLSATEETQVIDYLNEMADRGFPLSHRRVAEVVSKIVSARLGDAFPKSGVGINWTYRFATRNAHRIKMWNSRPLEEKRGRAANPNTIKRWWELLEQVLTTRKVTPENIYGTDEVGVQPQGQGEKERVFGRPGKTAPYQQRAGTRENITLIVTICADGTAIAPTVIFKGKAHQIKIGYQRKGWTDGEIGADWMRLFKKATKSKLTSRDEWRLLILDGHNSHHTLEFLEHGLDVVIFGVFKFYLAKKRDELWRAEEKVIDKSNFLEILEEPWLQTFTPELIKKAFRKTGIVPFDPSVIKPEQLATSKETSCELHLPALVPALEDAENPVNILANMLINLKIGQTSRPTASSSSGNASNQPGGSGAADPVPAPESRQITRSLPPLPSPSVNEPSPSALTSNRFHTISDTLDRLAQSPVAHLVDPNTPVHSSDPAPPTFTCTMPQTSIERTLAQDLLAITPSTDNEVMLIGMLHQQVAYIKSLELQNVKYQTATILNTAYATQIKTRLAHKEDKGKKKGNQEFTPELDGNANVATDEGYIAGKRKQRELDEEVEIAKQGRIDARARWVVAVQAWEESEKKRKKDAEAAREFNKNLKKTAAEHKKRATDAKKKGKTVAAPKIPPRRPVPKAVKKPLLKDFLLSTGAEEGSEDDAAASGGSNVESSEQDAADDDSDDN